MWWGHEIKGGERMQKEGPSKAVTGAGADEDSRTGSKNDDE